MLSLPLFRAAEAAVSTSQMWDLRPRGKIQLETGKREEQRKVSWSRSIKARLVLSGFPHKVGVSPPETPAAQPHPAHKPHLLGGSLRPSEEHPPVQTIPCASCLSPRAWLREDRGSLSLVGIHRCPSPPPLNCGCLLGGRDQGAQPLSLTRCCLAQKNLAFTSHSPALSVSPSLPVPKRAQGF